jgi:hypothetical protein
MHEHRAGLQDVYNNYAYAGILRGEGLGVVNFQ